METIMFWILFLTFWASGILCIHVALKHKQVLIKYAKLADDMEKHIKEGSD
jgi:hypothetical protein